MSKKALRFLDQDNVVVALEDLQPGDVLCINGVDSDVSVSVNIPQGHKAATADIAKGENIVKYGHIVGFAKEDIKKGDYVHVHNVEDTITDWRGNIKHEYDPSTVTEISDEFIIANPPKLYGYRRKNGSVGFRNYLLVVSTCACGNQPVDDLQIRMGKRDDIVFVTNPSGCVILSNDKNIPYLGIKGADVTKDANEKLGVPMGAYIKATDMDSPAMNAGIQSGDIIVSLQEEEVLSYYDLVNKLLLREPEETITVGLMRQGPEGYTEIEVTVTLGIK